MTNGISLATLQSMNPGVGEVLMAGRRLQVPQATAASRSAASMPVPVAVPRKKVRQSLDRWAARYRVPGDLVSSVAWVESRHRQDVVSSAGAIGVMQLLPGTAMWLSSNVVKDRVDPSSHDENVRGGAAYLQWLLQRFGGDERLAVGSYFQGPGNTLECGLDETAENYVRKVADAREGF